ncbi:MAG: cysteine desulfurase [Bacilli bacterium]|nr:cysteine desulfurase [Bacilli bacterium]
MNRNDFLMLNQDIIFFDNAATTFKPVSVVNAITDYYNKYCCNAFRGDYKIGLIVDDNINNTRNLVKDYINANSTKEIIFTSGTTEGINIVAAGYFRKILKEHDEIILSKGDHASNIMPWQRLASELNLVIKYVDLDDSNYVTLDNIKRVVTPNTKVISLAYISNVIGDLRPIKEITNFAHQNGIYVVCDASQSVGHRKTDVQDLDVDFLVFSGHKMYGPTGIGVLYGKKDLLELTDPINLGGGMNETFTDFDYQLKELPTRFEAGTLNIAGIIGLGEAIKYINSIGIDKISEYEYKLREYLVNKLIKLDYIDIINLESDSGIVTFNVDGIFAQDVAIYLDKYNICVRAGNHCTKLLKDVINVRNTIRISLAFYNTTEEIDTLVDLLSDKDKIIREML